MKLMEDLNAETLSLVWKAVSSGNTGSGSRVLRMGAAPTPKRYDRARMPRAAFKRKLLRSQQLYQQQQQRRSAAACHQPLTRMGAAETGP